MIIRKLLLLLSVTLLLFATGQINAETQFIKYKNYLIPISSSEQQCDTTNSNGYHKVIITTDLNKVNVITNQGQSAQSDPDDIQSLVHLLATSQEFEVRGLISSPSANYPSGVSKINAVLDAYQSDFYRISIPYYSSESTAQKGKYPSPTVLKNLVYQGLSDLGNSSIPNSYDPSNSSHAGVGRIIQEAQAMLQDMNTGGDPCQRLYVLVWGGITDLALALKHSDDNSLGLEQVIRTYFIASTNRIGSQGAYDYIKNNFLHNTATPSKTDRLWFIQAEGTFRGMHERGTEYQDDNLLDAAVGKGCLGYALGQAADVIETRENDKRLKAGDTPSLLYLLDGNQDDPTGVSWGGQFRLASSNHTQWWLDKTVSISDIPNVNSNPNSNTIGFDFTNKDTVNTHIPTIYTDWLNRANALPNGSISECRAMINQQLF